MKNKIRIVNEQKVSIDIFKKPSGINAEFYVTTLAPGEEISLPNGGGIRIVDSGE